MALNLVDEELRHRMNHILPFLYQQHLKIKIFSLLQQTATGTVFLQIHGLAIQAEVNHRHLLAPRLLFHLLVQETLLLLTAAMALWVSTPL